MADVKPFAALRPKAELAAQICELPYDVMSSEEARELASGNPLSFLHVSKPEIDLPPGTDIYSPAVYAKGRENFEKLMASGALRQDARPGYYLYRQVMGNHAQAGLVAAASCEDYLGNIIKKHELTRVDKEDDRVRHIETLNSQTGPVFLTYRANAALDELFKKRMAETPEIDFTAKDGVRHTAWVLGDAETMEFITGQFARISFLYICDGHHRSAAAARVYQARKDQRRLIPLRGTATIENEGASPAATDPELLKTFDKLGVTPEERERLLRAGSDDQRRLTSAATRQDESATFLAVIFPHDQMQILPYNRVLKDLNGLTAAQLIEKLDEVFIIRSDEPGAARPLRKHELGLFLAGRWHALNFRRSSARRRTPSSGWM